MVFGTRPSEPRIGMLPPRQFTFREAQKERRSVPSELAFDRDMFWLEKHLDKEWPEWRSSIKQDKEKIAVDKNLTAEKVFANGKAAATKIHPLGGLSRLNDKPRPIAMARQLSEYETARLRGLRRIHEMAGLKLFNDRCGLHPGL